ncbi:hypothetical protein D3C78_966500 [compost metagenome]
MAVEEGREVGHAHRGHGVEQAEELHADFQAGEAMAAIGLARQLGQPVDEGARLRRTAGKAVDVQLQAQ